MVTASWLRVHSPASGALTQLRNVYLQRGVTAGRWHEVVRAAAGVVSSSPNPIPGFSEGVRAAKGGELLPSLQLLLEERNRWAHSAGPRSEPDAVARLEQLLPALVLATKRASFLSQSPWVLVENCAFDRGRKTFMVSARIAMGDHPDFELTRFESRQPLANATLYARCGEVDMDLTPFVVVRHCDLCHQTELFFSDRVEGKGVVLKGFRHGHTVKAPELLSEIDALGLGGTAGH